MTGMLLTIELNEREAKLIARALRNVQGVAQRKRRYKVAEEVGYVAARFERALASGRLHYDVFHGAMDVADLVEGGV